MKMSIRNRLFLTVSLLIVFFAALSWMMNSTYLEKYYVNENKRQLIVTSTAINSAYSGDVTQLYLQLEKLERLSGVNILILDKNYAIKYYSQGDNEDLMPGPERKRQRQTELLIPLVTDDLNQLQNKQRIVVTTQDPNIESGLLNVVSRLDNGDYLILSKPLVSLGQSAQVANQFALFTGLVTILLGMGVIFFFSRSFTKPIVQLNDIAQKMSRLDFSEKYIPVHEDEIGELGSSINSLSDQLSRSISELQAVNQKLQQEIQHERRVDEMRKQFISNVSHELKTPIALIQGYAEGLKENIVQDEEGKNFYCEVIADEAAKMNKMVLELLDLSQIESGYMQLEKEVFDLTAMVRQMVVKYQQIFKDGKIMLAEQAGENLWAYADRARIEQVLANYLSNALNHVDQRSEIKVGMETRDGKVRIAVFNSGRPIPEEDQAKVFTSFYKVDRARTRAYGGTGLGLSIVRAIMEMHRNAYGTQNVPGGVEFWFEVDRAVPA